MPSHDLSLTELLARLSRHLDALSGEVHVVEHGIGSHLSGSDLRAPRAITQLQSLDYLRQSLEDLALVAHLAGRLPEVQGHHCSGVDAIAAKLTLQRSKALLQSGQMPVPTDFADTGQGDVDLF